MADTAATIAIVDDDAGTVDVLTRYFEHHGYAVVSAGNGVEALALVGRARPDILILDVMMPALDGFEVAERLRNLDPPIPIIMLSAKVDQQDKIRGLMTGASRYLTKPCSPAKVLEEVTKLLGTRRWIADVLASPESETETLELDGVAPAPTGQNNAATTRIDAPEIDDGTDSALDDFPTRLDDHA